MPNGIPSPFVKSFFAESIQAAMNRARLELGTEALLITSREAPAEARHLGAYEVVFGVAPDETQTPEALEAAAAPEEPEAPAPAPAAAPHPANVGELKRRVDRLRESLVRPAAPAAARRDPAEAIAQALIEAGVEAELAHRIGAAVRQRVARRSVPRMGSLRPVGGRETRSLLQETADEIAANFEVIPKIGRVTALVGPAGSGKTTTLVKLAITQGLAHGRAVRLISTDTHRIGGAEQLRAYATILGADFQAAENAATLARAIESAPPPALVLIDTAGYSRALLQDVGGETAAFLSRRQDIDTHLVLTASTRLEDLYNTAELYDAFGPGKLLFTRVDETSSLAAVFCAAARLNKPLSFLCAGQSVPEDLEPAAKEKVIESLVRRLPSAMEAAA